MKLSLSLLSFVLVFSVTVLSCNTVAENDKKDVFEYTRVQFNPYRTTLMLTQNEIREDLEMLKYLFRTSYVLYEDMMTTGRFDFEQAFIDIEARTSTHSGLLIGDFFEIIVEEFEGLPDSHILFVDVYGGERYASPKFSEQYWSTGLIVEKRQENYIVVTSPDPSSQPGDVFIHDGQDLVPIFSENKELYLVGTFSTRTVSAVRVELERDNKRFDVFFDASRWESNASESHFIYQSDKQVYIRLPAFDDKTRELITRLEGSNDFAEKVRDCEIIIFDLRNNEGGNPQFIQLFLMDLFGITYSPYERYDKNTFFGVKEIISPAVTQAKLANMIDNPVSDDFRSVWQSRDAEMRKNPRTKFLRGLSYEALRANQESMLASKKYDFNGSILILVNNASVSAGEVSLFYIKDFVQESIIVGENTQGAMTTGNSLTYFLPQSNIAVKIPSLQIYYSYRFTDGMDEPRGIPPDYWVNSDQQLAVTLEAKGVSKDLLKVIFAQ